MLKKADQQQTHFSVVTFLCQFIGSNSRPAFQRRRGVTIVTEYIIAMGYINTKVCWSCGCSFHNICVKYHGKMGRDVHCHRFRMNSNRVLQDIFNHSRWWISTHNCISFSIAGGIKWNVSILTSVLFQTQNYVNKNCHAKQFPCYDNSGIQVSVSCVWFYPESSTRRQCQCSPFN